MQVPQKSGTKPILAKFATKYFSYQFFKNLFPHPNFKSYSDVKSFW